MDDYSPIDPNVVMNDLAAQMVDQARRFLAACQARQAQEAREALHTMDTLAAAAAGLLGVERGR